MEIRLGLLFDVISASFFALDLVIPQRVSQYGL